MLLHIDLFRMPQRADEARDMSAVTPPQIPEETDAAEANVRCHVDTPPTPEDDPYHVIPDPARPKHHVFF